MLQINWRLIWHIRDNLVLLAINNNVLKVKKTQTVQIPEVISGIVFASTGKSYNVYKIVCGARLNHIKYSKIATCLKKIRDQSKV